MPARIPEDAPDIDGATETDYSSLTDSAVEADITDEEVVISGVSCRLPESENVEEFRQHLSNGEDMVTDDDRRWPQGL